MYTQALSRVVPTPQAEVAEVIETIQGPTQQLQETYRRIMKRIRRSTASLT
jgi:hypothetical protein